MRRAYLAWIIVCLVWGTTYLAIRICLETIPPLYAYINPVIAVILGTLILKEPFSMRMAVAAAVVLAGMALVSSTTA